jgi:hypothetical protein
MEHCFSGRKLDGQSEPALLHFLRQAEGVGYIRTRFAVTTNGLTSLPKRTYAGKLSVLERNTPTGNLGAEIA